MNPTQKITIPLMDLKGQTAALKEQLLARFSKALDDTAFCLGPEVEAFEREFAAYCGLPNGHGVGMNSGTSALHLALLALGVGAGDDVVTTPFTFVATSWAISYCGAKPVFADIVPGTFTIDPAKVEQAITPRTKAIVGVHLYGQPMDLEPLLDIAKKKGLPLIEDAAQAHGATYKGRRVGSFGAIAAFSFYPSKNLGACGEGGIAITSDSSLAQKMRALREHGSTKRYYHDTIGFNYRMEGLQGAALRVKLPHLDGWNARRQKLAAFYNERLAQSAVKTPPVGAERTHVYHLYVVRHARRDELAEYLRARGIGTGMHYPLPLHLQKAYAHLGLGEGSYAHSEAAARECLSLPLYPELTGENAEKVAGAVLSWKA
ncbi:MAG TPA: DegT/DnrJ/EryC1/StrS family aminotransferase [Planctomycetota bacterium]|nr:DegT/DnrJ/EryC1/StrS family aminotransferase [Planctomycetota bacterium]